MIRDPWQVVRDFEDSVAWYAGSKYAVAVDTCSFALFACCSYLKVETVTIPAKTYCSVPQSIVHAGGRVQFDSSVWFGDYELEPYPIIDSACRFRKGMHEADTFRCVSFNWRKHLPIGRGGMILCDDSEAVE